jgi:hypothetical protein
MGFSYLHLDNYGKASENINRAKDFGMKNEEIYWISGLTNYYLENFDSCISDLTIVEHNDPEFLQLYFYRSQCYKESGNLDLYISDFSIYQSKLIYKIHEQR